MKKEIEIFLNPNQQILLRNFQKEFRAVPFFPISIKCGDLKNLDDKISKIEAKKLSVQDGIIKIEVEIILNQKRTEGFVELCDSFKELSEIEENLQKKFQENLLKFKKISPFRICEIEREECENGRKWKILREKWGKLP